MSSNKPEGEMPKADSKQEQRIQPLWEHNKWVDAVTRRRIVFSVRKGEYIFRSNRSRRRPK